MSIFSQLFHCFCWYPRRHCKNSGILVFGRIEEILFSTCLIAGLANGWRGTKCTVKLQTQYYAPSAACVNNEQCRHYSAQTAFRRPTAINMVSTSVSINLFTIEITICLIANPQIVKIITAHTISTENRLNVCLFIISFIILFIFSIFTTFNWFIYLISHTS